ncbi:hypothetical protein PRK78_006748 [Emydomyces testavorans]|uniref:Delta(24)-sterol reductase n=1 Tax=Emydomyces testavorans TaxID=2070801 RepID=A0AAF0IL29_9EURO|nr:hypothetical protein PRK78_006748 [Emydomyces testavorans]
MHTAHEPVRLSPTTKCPHHSAAVSALSTTIRAFHTCQLPFRIYHGATNSTRPQTFQHNRIVDLSAFTRILHIDPARKTALVEPNVSMDRLVAATRAHGLVPEVVMEFPGITVGGGFAGTGAESSSFRRGFFDEAVRWVEVVLGNGEVVGVGKEEEDDGGGGELFAGVSGSFGTMGVTTLLEIGLVEARGGWVEVRYFAVAGGREAVELLEEKMRDEEVDYVDGILFARDRGVVVTGRRMGGSEGDGEGKSKVQRFSRSIDEWFYIHAERMCSKSLREPATEYVPLEDYLFRYDRGAFWVARFAYDYFFIPFNRFTRWLLDYFMHTRLMYHALHKSGLSSGFIIQDMALPWSAASEFIDYLDENFSRYPLWLRPIKPHANQHASFHPQIPSTLPQGSSTDGNDKMLLNIGLWAPGPSSHRAFIEANRALEHKIYALRGTKWLYAQTFYTENEFWSIYDRGKYDALREKYHASWLPSVYDKVKTDPEMSAASFDRRRILRPLPGLYGALRAAIGGGYLLPHRRVRMILGVVLVCLLGRVLLKWLQR